MGRKKIVTEKTKKASEGPIGSAKKQGKLKIQLIKQKLTIPIQFPQHQLSSSQIDQGNMQIMQNENEKDNSPEKNNASKEEKSTSTDNQYNLPPIPIKPVNLSDSILELITIKNDKQPRRFAGFGKDTQNGATNKDRLECPRQLICPLCQMNFADKRRRYVNHLEIHEGLRPFLCVTCGVGYESEIKLLEHGSRAHLADPAFTCGCGKIYKTHRGITHHQVMKKCNHYIV